MGLNYSTVYYTSKYLPLQVLVSLTCKALSPSKWVDLPETCCTCFKITVQNATIIMVGHWIMFQLSHGKSTDRMRRVSKITFRAAWIDSYEEINRNDGLPISAIVKLAKYTPTKSIICKM